MKRNLLLIFILLFSLLRAAAGTVSGTVKDSAGHVLSFASVYIKELNKGTNTNSEGFYSIRVEPGEYTLVCQYVGFARQERRIVVTSTPLSVDFVLKVQELRLGEVVLTRGEDPAYAIIREAIRKRGYYLAQLDKFSCEVYTKGQLRLRDFPDKILGQKVDFEDGDSSKRKMIYLSETVSRFIADKPNKSYTEVISSRVSGQTGGYGLSAPGFLVFYENNVNVGDGLNPRGFISPIADNALNYYSYKWEGSFWEDGREINHIKVIPKRKYEPLFSGYIDIAEDEWRIHAVNLGLVKSAQLQLLDTLRIEQLYRPFDKDRWFVSTQVIRPAFKFFGFDGFGSFVNVYSDFNPEPVITKKTFGSTVIRYADSANKRIAAYWEERRPVPLLEEEVRDYRQKDSLAQVRRSPGYQDSLDRKFNKPSLTGLLLLGQTYRKSGRRLTISQPGLVEILNFHPAEGLLLNLNSTILYRPDTNRASRRMVSISPIFRYGFLNKHLNPSLRLVYIRGKKYAQRFSLAGGRAVFQYNPDLPVSDRDNTFTTLVYGRMIRKTYEAAFMRAGYAAELGSGFSFKAGIQYQDRRSLQNLTEYTWSRNKQQPYSPDYPVEIQNSPMPDNQALILAAKFRWQPGARYMQLPERIVALGSKYPVVELEFTQGIKGPGGSDASFSRWKLGVADYMNLKMAGALRFKAGAGGFLSARSVFVPDYQHFNGVITNFTQDYMNSYQLLPQYLFSNTASMYGDIHVEYNMKGLLTNKIPVLRKLNLYLVTGFNGIYINRNSYYYEASAGFDNIFKQLRIDYVQSWLNGKSFQQGFRIGIPLITNNSGKDDWP